MRGSERRKEVLQQVEACVCRDRQNAYGDAEDNFRNIAEHWTLWLRQRKLLADGVSLAPIDVAAMSAQIKLARAAENPMYLDNWVDGAGYFTCGGGIVLATKP